MYIKQLDIHNLRIIENGSIEPSQTINLISGDNGAGKTSVLEAIYLLGRGKSFRHRETGPFIQTGFKHSTVVGELVTEDGSQGRLGVQREKRAIRVRFDGEDILRRSRLLRILPLQIITPGSHELIEKGPDARRGFIDYGMFHVEHDYLEQVSEYTRALKQRNSALRQSQIEVARSYNPLLSDLGMRIHNQRVAYVSELAAKLRFTLQALGVTFPVEISLNPGWNSQIPLDTELRQREDTDIRRGYTTIGVHRADLIIRTLDSPAAQRLSRGQQKVLVYAIKIAQSQIYLEKTGIRPILLIDDLGAELDAKHLGNVMKLLHELKFQIFITLVSTEHMKQCLDSILFHVEHGVISSKH